MRIGHGSLKHAMEELRQVRDEAGEKEREETAEGDRRARRQEWEADSEEKPNRLALLLAALIVVLPALAVAAGLLLLAFRLFIG